MRKIVRLYNEGLHDDEVSKDELEALDELVTDQMDWEAKAYQKGLRTGVLMGMVGMLAVAVIKK